MIFFKSSVETSTPHYVIEMILKQYYIEKMESNFKKSTIKGNIIWLNGSFKADTKDVH